MVSARNDEGAEPEPAAVAPSLLKTGAARRAAAACRKTGEGAHEWKSAAREARGKERERGRKDTIVNDLKCQESRQVCIYKIEGGRREEKGRRSGCPFYSKVGCSSGVLVLPGLGYVKR